MKTVLCLVLCCFAMSIAGKGFAIASSVPDGYVKYLDDSAWIDGSDWFESTGNQWRWLHWQYNIPGVENVTTPIPTVVNGQSFVPDWPDGTGEYTFSAYSTVDGLVPIQDALDLNQSLYLNVLSGREITSITQSPVLGNGYTMRVFLNDNEEDSADTYNFQIWGAPKSVNAVPEPISAGLFLLGGSALAVSRKRKVS